MKPTKININIGLLLGSMLLAQTAWSADAPVGTQMQNNTETATQAREQSSFTSQQQVRTTTRNNLDELEVTMGVIADDTAAGDNMNTIELPLQTRDRLRDQIHDADQDRDRDRLKTKEQIEDMTRDRMREMGEYREQMQNDMREHQSETMQDIREQTRQGGKRMGM